MAKYGIKGILLVTRLQAQMGGVHEWQVGTVMSGSYRYKRWRFLPVSTVLLAISMVIFTVVLAMEVLLIQMDKNQQLSLKSPSNEPRDLDSTDRENRLMQPLDGRFQKIYGLRALRQEAEVPEPLIDHGNWQPVVGTLNKFYVYSAFLDPRKGNFIRIVAATKTRNSDKVSCIYSWHDGPAAGRRPVTVPASIKVIRENWGMKYSAVFLLCPLDRTEPIPDEVSVVVAAQLSTRSPGNRLRILNRRVTAAADDPPSGFAVCVKPLHNNFNKALQLMEFIEVHRMLGVQHFIFYNHTTGADVDCLLRSYVDEGLVTVLPWQLDMVSQKEIRTEGLFAAINDCLYRGMYRFRFLLMVDVDEFILPRRNITIRSMISGLRLKGYDPSKTGAFSFMNCFHYLQWINDPISQDLPVAPLVTLQKTRRRTKFHPHRQRSKCIVVGQDVVEMGNHFVWEFMPGKQTTNVPSEIAFVHHYRVCEFGGDDCVKEESVIDRTAYRYKIELLQRILERLKLTRRIMHCAGCLKSNVTIV